MARKALAARTGRPARRACRATRARQARRACAARLATTAWQGSCHAVTDGRAVHSGQTTALRGICECTAAESRRVPRTCRLRCCATVCHSASRQYAQPRCTVATVCTGLLGWLLPCSASMTQRARYGSTGVSVVCCRAGWHARQDRAKGSRRYDRQRQRLQQTRASCNVFVQQAARHVSCT